MKIVGLILLFLVCFAVAVVGAAAVTVRADARAPYSTVAQVLAATRRAGVRDASLLVIKPRLSE